MIVFLRVASLDDGFFVGLSLSFFFLLFFFICYFLIFNFLIGMDSVSDNSTVGSRVLWI